jgi:hypothetical protein
LAILAQNVSAGVGSNAGSGIRALSGGGTLSDIHPVDPDILTPDWDAAGEFAGPCGVIGVATSTGIGVIGRGVRGVFGYGTSSGVFGKSFGGIGVDGISTEGTGVSGGSEIGIGVGGASQHGYGVYGSSNQDGYAVYAEAQSGIGVSASSISSYGVTGSSGTGVGVAGGSDSSDGLRGASNSGYGVHGISSTNYAGYFEGSLYAQTYIDLPESVVPPAPSANGARLFVRDNGSGKTQLCVLFPTGAVQVVATEP